MSFLRRKPPHSLSTTPSATACHPPIPHQHRPRNPHTLHTPHPPPSEPPTPVIVARTLHADPILISTFADEVAHALDGSVLRYSVRLALLRRAATLGIGRFEANLIIATVQHHHQTTTTATTQKRPTWLANAAIALAVQTAILLALWYLLRT